MLPICKVKFIYLSRNIFCIFSAKIYKNHQKKVCILKQQTDMRNHNHTESTKDVSVVDLSSYWSLFSRIGNFPIMLSRLNNFICQISNQGCIQPSDLQYGPHYRCFTTYLMNTQDAFIFSNTAINFFDIFLNLTLRSRIFRCFSKNSMFIQHFVGQN